MMTPFGEKVLPAPPDALFEAHVMFEVETQPDMNSSNKAVRDAARERFFAEVLGQAAYWQRWIVEQGGAILNPSLKSMPMFTMRATARLYRTLAWTPGIVRISERVRGAGGGGGGYTDSFPTNSLSVGEVGATLDAPEELGLGGGWNARS